MFRKSPKKDKRTDLDKRIDEISAKLEAMKTELGDSPCENLDEQIDSLHNSMFEKDAGSENYLNMAKALDLLYKAKASVKSKSEEYSEMVENYKTLCEQKNKELERKAIIKKTIILATAQLVGLAIVVKHEDVNIITGKAFGLIPWVKQ